MCKKKKKTQAVTYQRNLLETKNTKIHSFLTKKSCKKSIKNGYAPWKLLL